MLFTTHQSDQATYHPRRPTHRIDEFSQPWTTARCRRLLRPLVLRINSLRKEIALASHTALTISKSTSRSRTAISSISGVAHNEEPDAEFRCLASRKKRLRHTYSQRRGPRPPECQSTGLDQSRLGQSTNYEDTGLTPGTKSVVKRTYKCVLPEAHRRDVAPGEIVASTPLLRRARGENVVSPAAPVEELDLGFNQTMLGRGHRMVTGSNAQKQLDERLVNLRKHQLQKYADLEAIYRSLEALLKATAKPGIDSTKGPRSLLDMCLRRVPQYISELEAWERLEAEQSGTVSTLNIDTSAQIYNELETLGTNIGWRHLRVVVRADGLNAVRQGIEDGVFGDEFSQLLIDLCIHLGAASESEELLTALVDRQYPQPMSTESGFAQTPVLQPLVWLNSFANYTQRTSILFRQYVHLLLSGALPRDWLATAEFERIWTLAAKRLAKTDPCPDAINFISEAIQLLASRKRMCTGNDDTAQIEQDMAKASQRTLMSTLAILASMSLLGETELESPYVPESDTRRIVLIGDRLRYIIRACLSRLVGHKRGRCIQKLEFVYLALFLSSKQCPNGEVEIRVRRDMAKLSSLVATPLSAKDNRTRYHYDSIAWLIASMARACGRGMSVSSHQYLDDIFKRLETLQLGENMLDNLKAAAAFLIAQQTSNVRDLIYAESLHSHDQPKSPTSHQRTGGTLFTGYRWEEAIGEWVTVSPVLNKRRVITMKKHLRSSPSDGKTGSLPTSPREISGSDTDNVSEAGTSLGPRTNKYEFDAGHIPTTCIEQSMPMKKRPRSLQSSDTLATHLETTDATPSRPPAQQSLIVSPSSRLGESQYDPEKENRVRLLAKKPRRSSGRIVLGARAPGRHSIGGMGKDGVYSDDELCI